MLPDNQRSYAVLITLIDEGMNVRVVTMDKVKDPNLHLFLRDLMLLENV